MKPPATKEFTQVLPVTEDDLPEIAELTGVIRRHSGFTVAESVITEFGGEGCHGRLPHGQGIALS
jgi:hypothetical protein